MTPDTKKGIFITLGIIALVLVLAYLCFHVAQMGLAAEKQMKAEQQVLQRSIDSLTAEKLKSDASVIAYRDAIDMLWRQDSAETDQLKELQREKNTITQKYNALTKFNTLSAADIGGYLSDSLP